MSRDEPLNLCTNSILEMWELGGALNYRFSSHIPTSLQTVTTAEKNCTTTSMTESMFYKLIAASFQIHIP